VVNEDLLAALAAAATYWQFWLGIAGAGALALGIWGVSRNGRL
jgi:hypothetical protein